MVENKNNLAAIVEIGSTGVRLLVAEIFKNETWRILDQANKHISMGRDVFTSGRVSRESVQECLAVLRNFMELLDGWGIGKDDTHVIATSAFRAAHNRDMLADMVFQKTGCRIAIVEGIEETRLVYLAVRFAIKNDVPLFWRANSMIIELGGGSTEIMLLRRGKMVAAHSLKLGTILVDQEFRLALGSQIFQEHYLNEKIRITTELLSKEMDIGFVRTVIVPSASARIVAINVGKEFNANCWVIERDAFLSFTEKVRNYSVEDCVEILKIPYAEAEGLVPAILIYKLILERTAAAIMVVPFVSLREGMLIDLASQGKELREEFYSQIIASAINLGRKYHYDENHNQHVASLAIVIFDALSEETGLTRRDRLLLEVAGILHDIGMFIKSSGHHRHGQYIVSNSEIFGLQTEEMDIISNIIYFHRGEGPRETDTVFFSLQREERMLVMKLTAILRVADALDRGHSRNIRNISVERQNDTLVIRTSGVHDIKLEHRALEEKGNLFEDVFGYTVLLS